MLYEGGFDNFAGRSEFRGSITFFLHIYWTARAYTADSDYLGVYNSSFFSWGHKIRKRLAEYISLLWPMIRLSHNSMVDKHNFQEYTLHFCNDMKVVAAREKSEPCRT